MMLLSTLLTLICIWYFGYFVLRCSFSSSVQEQISLPVNLFLIILLTTVMTESFQPSPTSGPIAGFHNVLIHVLRVVFLLWDLLVFPCSLQFFCEALCSTVSSVLIAVFRTSCSFNIACLWLCSPKCKAKHRACVCLFWGRGALCFPSCASCCCVYMLVWSLHSRGALVAI